jgi:hypothetical protein
MSKLLLFFLAVLLLSGCTQTYYLGRVPQAQFTYPNANVTPMTKVKGESSTRLKLFMMPSVSSAAQSEAYTDALRKAQGADVLINLDTYHKITQLIVIPIYWSKYQVEGTSAKQEIGKQKLK